MQKKDILIRWLIVAWLVGLMAGAIALSEAKASNILSMPIAAVGMLALTTLEIWCLRKMCKQFVGRKWGIILLALISVNFSVGFYFLNKLVFVALVILAARVVLGFLRMIPATTVRTVYRDSNNREHEIVTGYFADEDVAKRMAEDEIKRRDSEAKIIEQE